MAVRCGFGASCARARRPATARSSRGRRAHRPGAGQRPAALADRRRCRPPGRSAPPGAAHPRGRPALRGADHAGGRPARRPAGPVVHRTAHAPDHGRRQRVGRRRVPRRPLRRRPPAWPSRPSSRCSWPWPPGSTGSSRSVPCSGPRPLHQPPRQRVHVVDVELSWIDSRDDLMDLAEELLRHALGAVRDAPRGRDRARVFGVPVEVPATAIPRVRPSARRPGARLPAVGPRPAGSRTRPSRRCAATPAARPATASSSSPGTPPPIGRSTRTGTTIRGPRPRSFDLLWGGMEVGSGCQREHRDDGLRAQAQAAGIGTEAMARYLDRHWLPMFGHGCPPHGGFGLGLDRLLMALPGGARSARRASCSADPGGSCRERRRGR